MGVPDPRLLSDDPDDGFWVMVQEMEKLKAQLEQTAEERDLLKAAVIELHKRCVAAQRDYVLTVNQLRLVRR